MILPAYLDKFYCIGFANLLQIINRALGHVNKIPNTEHLTLFCKISEHKEIAFYLNKS